MLGSRLWRFAYLLAVGAVLALPRNASPQTSGYVVTGHRPIDPTDWDVLRARLRRRSREGGRER
jgi:hypothetical protein